MSVVKKNRNFTKDLPVRLGIFLCLALLFSAVLLSCGQPKDTNSHQLSPGQFQQIAAEKGGIILDVRTPEEYNEGHIEGSMLIDFKNADFQQRIDSLDKEKIYFVYCRSGNRSSKAIGLMQKAGFKNLYHLEGGILAWKEKSLPLTK